VEALAIRLSAQLGAVSYAHGDEVVVDDTTNQEGHEKTSSWNLGLWVAPGLQVRLYF
jgi:hypothetical protein